MWRVLAYGALIGWLALGMGCEGGSARSAAEIETIDRVPPRVLTIEDLAIRVQRSRGEVGVRVEGLQVVGVFVRRATPCDLQAVRSCDMGPAGKHLFAEPGVDPAYPTTMSVLLVHGSEQMREGERYVLDGSVEMAPDVPQRWVFRGQVLARVR